MAETDLKSLRLVIQQRGISPVPSYRIIVYGDAEHQSFSDYNNSQILVETLRAAIPNFDVSQLALNPLGEGQGSMVFLAGMDLDKHQLTVLGLS